MRGAQVLSHQIEICDIDDTNAHLFELAGDRYGGLMWDQGSVPAEDAEPGAELTKTWEDFGGGMGETYDIEERIGFKTGAYYFSNDCQVTNPFRIRPRQALTSVTLTNNNTEVTQFFEAKSASGIKYLYPVTDTKAHKVQISGTPTLKNTKDFSVPNIHFATGSYTSDGESLHIPLDFPPKAVIIKAIGGAYAAVTKTDEMPLHSYKDADGTYTTGDITDFLVVQSTGISFAGTHTGFNHDGTTYCWMAFGGTDAYVKTGKFSGNATDDRDITIDTDWGQPDALFIFTNNDADHVVFKPKDATTDLAWDIASYAAPAANLVQATADWPTDGFEVGDDNRVNRSGTNNVFYLALKECANVLTVDSYTGDGNDDRAVTGVGYEPDWVLTCAAKAATRYVFHRSDYCSGDSTLTFIASATTTNKIQDFNSDGFEVGTATDVNENTETFYFLSVRTDPSGAVVCGQPAEWNDIWELPKGADVDRAGLTAIVDGTGDDTWTTRSTGSPKASHLCVIENELVRASADRVVDKCAANDTDVDGNWAGDYNVGQPGTKITKLVNVAGECGVGTTDGFYLWDTVSTSRQQLGLLGGIADDENAKGTTVVGNLVLIPTVDGDWRWVAGGAVPFGPDSNDGYVEVKGPSSIPRMLKHYDHAFLGRYIYHACYDGTNYHIIYTKLNLNDPTLARAKWDFLLTTTTAVKELHVDTERRLWFSYGNNVAFFTLSRGGAPTGGNWGTASGSGNFYHPITNMGTEALKRLRLVEIVTENIPANFNFSCSVYRDGATVESVGDAITSNGVGECFWTAGTDDTAREIQLRPNWAAAAGFSASTTAPGIKKITLHAEALEEDADLIVCSVQLGENAKEQKAIIDRHLNAGVLKATNALSGARETVVLYRRRYHTLEQRGNEPPISACELRFRRSDTS